MSIAQLNYLNELAKMNVINNILDIGANRGEFSLMCNHVFKTSNIVMVEGNENCRSILEALPFKCFISLLSDDKKEVEFFTNKNNPICTGSSYYKEVTNHYIDAVSKKVQTETLDDLLKDYTEPFDLIKIDTQGSEADIMRGGKRIFSSCSWVMCECPFAENENTPLYNKNSGNINDICELLYSMGFSGYYLVEELKVNEYPWNKETVVAKELLFYR